MIITPTVVMAELVANGQMTINDACEVVLFSEDVDSALAGSTLSSKF